MSLVGDIISSGGGFTNPLAASIDSVRLGINGIVLNFDNLIQGLPEWNNPQDVLDARSVLQQLESTLGQFGVHTDNLSGVGNGQPNMVTILSVSNAAKGITGSATCDLVNNAFGSLLKGAAFVNDVVRFVQDVVNFILSGPAAFRNTVSGLTDQFTFSIQQDINNFLDSQQKVLSEAIAGTLTNLFDDPCVGAILGAVVTPSLNNALQSANDALRQATTNVTSQIDNFTLESTSFVTQAADGVADKARDFVSRTLGRSR